jgi:hypothetical protein
MMMALIDNGAILDYRAGEKETWKTPLHIACVNNKGTAAQVGSKI